MGEDEVKVTFIQRDCNYLQALEGEIDTAHFGFLHGGHVDPKDVPVITTVLPPAVVPDVGAIDVASGGVT